MSVSFVSNSVTFGAGVIFRLWSIFISPVINRLVFDTHIWLFTNGIQLDPFWTHVLVWSGLVGFLMMVVYFVSFVFGGVIRCVRFFSDDVVRGARRMKA